MKIKKVSTSQFAGVNNREVEFADGINVIYGKNESGKSTIVNLVSSLLFQNAVINRKTDGDFLKDAFPTSGDYIDGTVVFELKDGEYTLEKTWYKEKSEDNKELSEAKLTNPAHSIFKTQAKIDEALSEEILSHKGIYKEMLFSPQSDAAENLRKLLSEKKESLTKSALAEAVSQAFAESDGISIDKIDEAIAAKVDLLGYNWNVDSDCPMVKSGNGRWNIAAKYEECVLKAYYDIQDRASDIKNLEELEKTRDNAVTAYGAANADERKAEDKQTLFDKYYENILELKGVNEKISDCEADKENCEKTLEKLRNAKACFEKADSLAKEKRKREQLDLYENAKKFHDELQAAKDAFSGMQCPTDEDINAINSVESEVRRLESELGGMNIDADITLLGGNSARLVSLLSGEEIALSESVRIKEAVRLEIPGVLEMTLSPAEVNAALNKQKIEELKGNRAEILGKYKCASAAELGRLRDNYNRILNEMKLAENNFKNALGENDFAKLETDAKALSGVREMSAIQSDILALCGKDGLDESIGSYRSIIKNNNEEELLKRIDGCESMLSELRARLAEVGEVPPEFNVEDPKAHKENLGEKVKSARAAKESAHAARTEAVLNVENYIKTNGDVRERQELAMFQFEQRKELLKKWLHIQEIFRTHKDALSSNPLEKLAESFIENLKVISESNVTAEFTDELGNPDFTISSGNNKVDYNKLSDGTKETTYLAFRLAVLDYLFPDGGGVIALDDPATNMDIGRMDKSCELIKKAGKKHQIIFLTCCEDYAELLGGNFIDIADTIKSK